MKKINNEYKEKLLKGLNPTNDLELVKSKLSFKSSTNVYKKSPKRIILFGGLSAVLACVIIVVLTVVITNFNNIPVYEGYEVIETNVIPGSGEERTRKNLKGTLLNGNIDDEINKGIIEEEMPDVVTGEKVEYFTKPNTKIIVAVRLANPKQFNILSITVNGYKYQSYEFIDGSTGNVVYLAFEVGSEAGIETFYIEEIKYIDDTVTKNARFNGDRSIKVGVTYQNIPTVDFVTAPVIEQNSYTLAFRQIDPDLLITENTFYKAYLFSNEGLIKSQTLSPGLSAFSVDNLEFNTYYQMIICAAIDLLDGNGLQTIYLYDNEFKTEAGIFNPVLEITQNSLNGTFSAINDSVTIINSSIFIKGSDTPLYTNESNQVSFSNLYSNTEYELHITYEYQINGQKFIDVWKSSEQMTESIITKTYEVPNLDFSLTSSHHQINANFTITDPNNLGKISKIELYLGESLVKTLSEDIANEVIFDLLFSNNEYKVIATYEYNLNDQTGNHEFTIEHLITTLVYDIPSYDFDLTSTKDQIDIKYEINDPNLLGKISKVELVLDNNIIQTITDEIIDNELTMKQLLSNNKYTIITTYTYDLVDNTGAHDIVIEKDIKTQSYIAPTFDGVVLLINGANSTKNVLLDLKEVDVDGVLNADYIVNIYSGETLLKENAALDEVIMGIDGSITEIKVEIIFTYDLHDGKGVQQDIFTQIINN